ncbi:MULTISPECIES: glycosyltransferase family 4 protein [Rhodomicrobium]|uniref:glycosyltransferase family 4 protein n=1 Tax=Rhodomicrobium TaxID=1068 RepID=UPI000B4B5817|nr:MULTISPECIES: glycosyltransferase family 4 protein [Rhodomicrobium]
MSTMPVILQIIPKLDTGGAERTVIEVAEAVRMAGGQALVASEGGRLEAELAAAGGELIRLPAAAKNPLTLLANARTLEKLIAERGVSLVHARSRAPAWSALMAARRANVPFVTTYHGVYNQKGALKAWYNSVMARGDRVIANSHYTAGIVRQRHRTPDERLIVIQRGVDLAQFSSDAVTAARIAALRARWGVDEKARLVVLAARLTRWKGQHVAIGAASQLRTRPGFDDVVFILAGDDQGRTAYREELAARIETLGLGHGVRLTGHCDDMPAAFATASLALVTSIEPEAFGRISVEAQAMGCPVIVSDLGAPPETIDAAAPTGWTVRPDDETALADAIAAALSLGAAKRAAIARAARHHAATYFSKAQLQRRTLEVYDTLLATGLAQALDQKLWANEDSMPSRARIPV